MYRSMVLFAGLAAVGGLASVGCTNTDGEKDTSSTSQVKGRSQIGEDTIGELDATTTVGTKTDVANTDPIVVSGVGLVYGLAGTGSSANPGWERSLLEKQLKREGYSVSEILDDPRKTTSLVLVSALVPPGARKGELIDIQVSLPEDSKTTSLKGGRLHLCDLYNSETTGNLNAALRNGKPSGPGGELKLGDVWAKAEGNLIAGVFIPNDARGPVPIESDGEGQPVYKVARIWGGGKVSRSRPYFITLKDGFQNARMALSIAARLNSTFHTAAEPDLKVAEVKAKELILANVPLAYRNNHHRFLLVARQVPILPPRADSPMRKRLEEELLDPRTTLIAALKLEAMGGTESVRSLRVGLESPLPWVRFASAESLTYLGQIDGAADLARLAEAHPALRAPCLKALASMDDAACTDRLLELMTSPDPMLRYGAFCALRLALPDESASVVRGEQVNRSYWLHTVAPGSSGMVHLTSSRRCEIVLFGDNLKLKGPFTLPVGNEYSIEVKGDEAKLTRIRSVKGKADIEKRELASTNDLLAALAMLGKLGGGYEDAVELIRRADKARVLSCPVVVDALTPELDIRNLTELAARDPALILADQMVVKAGVVHPQIDANGFDLPQTPPDPAAAAAPSPPKPALNRNPGHLIFKTHDTAPVDPGVVPPGGP